MSSKKLITSALPYVNNAPHLGNIIGCVLSADAYARYCRSKGYETLYICATDEYGTATENKARAEGMTPQEICDKYHVIHKEIYEHFNISFDYFGRTSYPEQTEITQSIFKDLETEGMIEEKETEQTYCEHDEMFLADRYVSGTCPSCGFDDARGDQCDNCGKLLQPTEIIDPKCQVCGGTPTRKLTTHLYVNLPILEERLKEFHKVSIEKGKWSNNAVTLTNGWLETGLISRPITRDLKWGISIPKPGYENKVFYVWFDAPIGYISTTKKALPDSWQDWWCNPEETELYQFMAKDNIPFHTVFFPGCLIGTNKNWTLLHHINATEYLNYENEKFSKSRNVGVFGTDVINSDIHVDLWRFYLLFNRPEKSDTNFTWNTFVEDINSNFIDNIGNLLNRVVVFLNKHFEGKITSVKYTQEQQDFLERVHSEEKKIALSLENVKLKDGLKGILALGKMGNKFFQDQQPWTTIKTDPELAKASLVVLIYLVRDLGIMLAPYMPDTSNRILSMLNHENDNFGCLGDWVSLTNTTVNKPQLLFKKLQEKDIKKYREKFSGKDAKEEDPQLAWKNILLKVGEIKEIAKHPSADLLYVEKIDCGEGRLRTVVSGVVKHYTPEQLVGKKVLIVANLTPADLRGVTSEGMLLAAENRKKLEVIEVESASIGTTVKLEGESDHQPPEQITISQFLAAKIEIENSTMKIKDKKLLIDGIEIKTKVLQKGKVK
jgi:methionyl-tRNA synthetase